MEREPFEGTPPLGLPAPEAEPLEVTEEPDGDKVTVLHPYRRHDDEPTGAA